jgi:hypothetical protein
MNVISFLFFAGCACIFLGIGIPYVEPITGICAAVIAIKSL